MIFRFCLFFIGDYPDLQKFKIFFIAAVIFAVIDTFSCAHYLDFSGRDDTLVLYTVSMF